MTCAIEMYRSGMTTDQIAKALGKNKKAIQSRIYRARRAGKLAKHTTNAWEVIYYRHGQCRGTIGNIKSMLQGLPREVGVWIADNTPEGAKVTDVIASILIDAMNEEMKDE